MTKKSNDSPALEYACKGCGYKFVLALDPKSDACPACGLPPTVPPFVQTGSSPALAEPAAPLRNSRIIEAAKLADWGQVVANGGPPCFQIMQDGEFCLRAHAWQGHTDGPEVWPCHKFVSLADLFVAAAPSKGMDAGMSLYLGLARSVIARILSADANCDPPGDILLRLESIIRERDSLRGAAPSSVQAKFTHDELEKHAGELAAFGMCCINRPLWEGRREIGLYIENHFARASSPSSATEPDHKGCLNMLGFMRSCLLSGERLGPNYEKQVDDFIKKLMSAGTPEGK